MHSKGTYSLNIFTKIENWPYASSYEAVNDYLAAAICTNIQTDYSYIQTLPSKVAHMVKIKIEYALKYTLCFNIKNNDIGVNNIAAVLSHNTKLQELYLAKWK